MKHFLTAFLLFSVSIASAQLTLIVPTQFLDSSKRADGKYDYAFKGGMSDPEKMKLETAASNAALAQGQMPGVQSTLNQHTSEINVLKAQIPPAGASIAQNISVTKYTLTMSDNGKRLYFLNAATVYFNGLDPGFHCEIIRDGGDVIFSGPYRSPYARTRVQTQYSRAVVDVSPTGIIHLSGELK